MPIRNPVYLDQDLLQNIADYLDIGYPVETKVREVGTRERTGSAGLAIPGTGVGAKGALTSSSEVETTYEAPVRPVKVLNDVLDRAIQDEDVKQFHGADAPNVARRDLVEIEGTVTLSAISEAGELIEKFMPMIVGMPGGTSLEGPQLALFKELISGEAGPRPLFYEVASDALPVPAFVQIDRGWFHRNAGPDDLSGDMTVFGLLDQLVPEGGTYDLVRFLLPGANRATRRMITPESATELMAKMGKPDQQAILHGPAWIVRPIAVY